MTPFHRALRTALIAGLAFSLFTCEDNTAPDIVNLNLFLSAPRDDIRAVVVEVDVASLSAQPTAGFSTFHQSEKGITRLVLVADPGNAIPTTRQVVAKLRNTAARRSAAHRAKVTQAAFPDYSLHPVDDFEALVDPE